MRPQRLSDPVADIEVSMDERLGVASRRSIANDIDETARSRSFPGVDIYQGDNRIARGVRKIVFTGAGVTVAVAGDTATITIP